MTARAYPLPRPESGNDKRFTFGLAYDVGQVLEAHGFPPVRNGSDMVDLQLALFRFVYVAEEQPTQPQPEHGPDPAVEDDSPLTLAELQSALAHWEQKASEAQAAGLRGEFDRRMEGVVTLRTSIRRLEGGPAVGQAVTR